MGPVGAATDLAQVYGDSGLGWRQSPLGKFLPSTLMESLTLRIEAMQSMRMRSLNYKCD